MWEAAPLLFCTRCAVARGKRYSSSFLPGLGKRSVRTFLRSCRGTHPLGCSASPCFAAESTREGTLMSLSEGAPARPGSAWARGGAVSSEVTSGCPKRSEGGCPCRNEDEHRPSSRIPMEKHAECLPNTAWGTKADPVSYCLPPPAHSRLVFKIYSLKGKQRRAPERVNKDAAIFHEEVPTYASTEHPTNPRRGSTPANPAA